MAAPDLWLWLGVVGFYVYDASLLLYQDEVVFIRAGRRWHASVGGMEVRGCYLYVPDLLLPARALHRAQWHLAVPQSPAGRTFEWPAPAVQGWALRSLAAGVTGQLVLLVFALPLALAFDRRPQVLLGMLAASYALTLSMGLMAYLQRGALGLSSRQVLAHVGEVLLCPPFSINFVRRLSLRRSLRGDAAHLCRRLLSPGRARSVLAQVACRVDAAATMAEPGSLSHAHLVAYRQRVAERAPCASMKS